MDEKEVLKALKDADKALDEAKKHKDAAGKASFSFEWPKDNPEFRISNLNEIPQPDPVEMPEFPDEIRISNLSEIPQPDPFKFPDSINLKKPAWLHMLFVPLRPIKDLLEDIRDKIQPIKFPTKASEAIPVRLSDGKDFINQLTQWVQSGGGGGSMPKTRDNAGKEYGLITSGLSLPQYTSVTMALSGGNATEIYTFKDGTNTVATVTIVYIDSTRDTLSSVTKS